MTIPRALVADALGLTAETDALPPGDLPLDRFAARYVAYLGSDDPGTETPDAWTGTVMDVLIETDPELAFAALRAGLPLDTEGRLADPLAELGARPGWAERIEAAAGEDPALAARLDTGA